MPARNMIKSTKRIIGLELEQSNIKFYTNELKEYSIMIFHEIDKKRLPTIIQIMLLVIAFNNPRILVLHLMLNN